MTLKLAHRPGSYFLKEIIRPKYALPQESEGGIHVAPLPESLLIRCQADESLLADILTKKFADHLPIYRQAEMLAREGINITRQTLSQWVVRAGMALEPLYNELIGQIIKSDNVFIDETPIDMLAPGKGKVHKAFMFVMCGGKEKDPSYRVYDFYTNPKLAALQGLEKMKLVHDLGVVQLILPPQMRPVISMLQNLGFTGSEPGSESGREQDTLEKAYKIAPDLLIQCSSQSAMWTANAATVTPSCDTQDGKVHITPKDRKNKWV